jgi:hypothetical protein
MRQTSVAIESAKGVNMHAIRPACTIFAIWSSFQSRWAKEEREFGTGKNKFLRRERLENGGFSYDARERMLETRVVHTREARRRGDGGPDDFNLCPRIEAVSIKREGSRLDEAERHKSGAYGIALGAVVA